MRSAAGGLERVVVIGGSLTGLFAAAALSGGGRQVVVVERDTFPTYVETRPGVPQGSQAHVLLYRGLLAAEELLPGLRGDLLAAGAVPFNGGRLLWRSGVGWFPVRDGFEVVSSTRPLLEHVVRGRTFALPGVTSTQGCRVSGLRREGGRWEVCLADGSAIQADLVVDASGRNSRLPVWLSALSVPPPAVSVVDAKVGYATRVYTDGAAELAGCPGVVVAATPETLTGGLALRAENDQWLVMGVGFGDRRPERDNDSFESFLAELGDPVLSDLVRRSTPAGDVHVHRQTASTRYWYEKVRPWPDGLIAVGDALCALDPVYGQGITVGAAQALVLRGAVCSGLGPRQSSSLQRKVASCVTTAWAIASSTDSSFPTAEAGQTRVEALMSVWTGALERLAVHGNERANDHMSRVYNLMASPVILLHPALLLAVARARLVGYGSPPARPKILEQLAGSRSST